MKALFFPTIIIIALIVFFVVTNRKEFNRCNTVRTDQSERAESNWKPAPVSGTKTKPAVDEKPAADTTPSAETKPVAESKPVAETKQVDTNQVDTNQVAESTPVVETKTTAKPIETTTATASKPATETKPAAAAKPADPNAPMGVPVVSPEEAENLNAFAFYWSTAKKTIVEGEIIERSELPDPEKSDYPNCRFTVHFKGNTIKSGEPCPKELSLLIDGFQNYRIQPNNNLKAGDKVLCTILPFELLPEDFQSIQQADDLELFLLDNYYGASIQKITDFSDRNDLMPLSGIFFSDKNEYVSIFEHHLNPPISDDIRNAQDASIQKDLEKMNKLLDGFTEEKIKEINLEFAEAWDKEKAKDAQGYNRVGNIVWRKLDNSFWALPSQYTFLSKPVEITQNSLECFSSLKKICEANGVQLIVSIVPDYYDISARVINRDFRNIPDLQTALYVKQLSEAGIESIYISDSIIENYNKFPFAFFYPSNNHPGDTAQDCLTDVLAERLKRYGLQEELDPDLFSVKIENTRIYNYPKPYLFPENCDTGSYKAGDIYECRHVYYRNDPLITKYRDSSIMIIGNSFVKTPMNASPDVSLPTLLMMKTLSGVDWYFISGGLSPFSDILIRMLSSPETFLKNKKVLIMQVGIDHLKSVFTNESMVDMAEIDSERLFLNNKKFRMDFIIPANATEEQTKDSSLWGGLINIEKSVLTIDESGSLEYHFTFDQDSSSFSNIDISAPIYCVIPYAVVRRNATCRMLINDISKAMKSSNSGASRFFTLLYELPPGTKEINVRFEGKPGSIFAVKDIQIWQ